MKLLLEVTENIQTLVEGKGTDKGYFIEGIFLMGDIKNKNGRIYPVNVLKEEVDKYTRNYIAEKRAFGELNHPLDNPSINLDRVSHRIVSLKQDGSNFIGKAKIMTEMPMGKIVKAFIDEGCKLAVSSRALGSLKEDWQDGQEVKVVQPDFMLTTAADIVHDPSAPQAFVESLRESVDWIMDAKTGKWIPKYMDKVFTPGLKNMKGKKAEQVAQNLFESFINKIGK